MLQCTFGLLKAEAAVDVVNCDVVLKLRCAPFGMLKGDECTDGLKGKAKILTKSTMLGWFNFNIHSGVNSSVKRNGQAK